MITYAQAMEAVQGVVCPECLHHELSAELQMVSRRECACLARCEHCGAEFEIEHTHFEPLGEIQARVALGLAGASCAVCGQTNYALSLKCDHPSQDCYFQARCLNCQTTYRVEELANRIRLSQSA